MIATQRTEEISRPIKIILCAGLKRGYFTAKEIEPLARFLLPNFDGITEHLLHQAATARRLERLTDAELQSEIEELQRKLN